MQIDSVQLKLGDDTINANTIKETVLKQLVNDKLLTEEQYKYYTSEWQVIICKKAWYKKLHLKKQLIGFINMLNFHLNIILT